MFKQTSGLVFAVVFSFYKILQIKSKDEIKEYIKIALTRFLGLLGILLIFTIYLKATGTLADFVDYAIIGIGTFSNKVSYLTLFKASQNSVKILATIFPIQIVVMLLIYMFSFIKREIEQKEWFKNLIILLAYSIGTSAVIFPITDRVHFAIGSMCGIISFIYLAYKIFTLAVKKETKIKKVMRIYFQTTAVLLLVAGAIYSIYMTVGYIKNPERCTDISHFKNIIIDEDLHSRIIEISDYIKAQAENGKTVYILDATAATYQIPAEKYNKNYDMINRGNLGGGGQNGVLADIENSENTELLILKEYYIKNWQHPTALTDYIIENYERVGEISIFDIYEK